MTRPTGPRLAPSMPRAPKPPASKPPPPSRKKSPVVSSTDEANLRRRVEQGELARALATDAVALPPVEAPSLEGLEVTVPAPPDVTEAELLERFHALRRELAERRPRAPGEPVEAGDEVVVDLLGFAGGYLLPFSVRMDFRTELAPHPALPGLFEQLVGQRMGTSLSVPVTFPPDHPVQVLRGVEGQFQVDLKEAHALRLPAEESAEFLARLGLGDTVDAVMVALRDELEEEHADALLVEAQERVLDELAERTRVELPPSLVDEEVRRQWQRVQGRPLALKGIAPEVQEADLRVWLADPVVRLEAERRLRVSLGLRALIEREKLHIDEAQVKEQLGVVAEALGLAESELKQALAEDRAVARTFAETAVHLRAVEYVMTHARIHFEGAER